MDIMHAPDAWHVVLDIFVAILLLATMLTALFAPGFTARPDCDEQ